jgi:N-acetylneuraminate synthase
MAYSMLGAAVNGAVDVEADSQRFRRSLYVVADVKKGEALSAENIRSIRPSGGLHTRYLESLLGKKALRDIPKGTPLSIEDIN